MSALRIILGDQLSRSMTSLQDIDTNHDTVLMVEVREETTYVPHHQQKIVFILSAMRHFAHELRADGITVQYVELESKENTGSFTGEVGRALERSGVKKIVITEPGEWRVSEMIHSWQSHFSIPVEVREDDRFLCSRASFQDWCRNRKGLRLEYFYRMMRQKTGWLMQGNEPVGGQWNYDAENRKALPKQISVPKQRGFAADKITRQVMDLVKRTYPGHIGDADTFSWAVTRSDALEVLSDFINIALPQFGDYQDAMKQGEDFLFHSVISPYINVGLLTAREVCEQVLSAYEAGNIPIAATEGFIRQILGWREFVRGLYWQKMPDYQHSNFLDAQRSLPEFYWSGETEMNCLRQSIEGTIRNAYAHHIQRLMITGNFALLTGINPSEVEAWYLAVYADAFEWVELPNTHGMALFADGGVMASKPYASSGAYINRMSDYCKHCRYSVKDKLGNDACPFNYLYWFFLIRNQDRLSNNPRMGMAYRNLARMSQEQKQAIIDQAGAFLDNL